MSRRSVLRSVAPLRSSLYLSSRVCSTSVVSQYSTAKVSRACYAVDLSTPLDTFVRRHIGPNDKNIKEMLATLKEDSLDSLISKTVPSNIRLKTPLTLTTSHVRGESETLDELKEIMKANLTYKSFIGLGYYGTKTPPVILRNIIENPGWYTPYTPYQAEISQGRLESLLNYQTVCTELTGLPIANASLLDEATAGAEAMTMCFASLPRKLNNVNNFFVSELVNPQTIDLIKTRAAPLGINVIVGDHTKLDLAKTKVAGAVIQYPAVNGEVIDYTDFVNQIHNEGVLVACATDLLALTVIKPPSEFGVDICFGSSQRLGVPMGYGGPHAAFLTTHDKYKRILPGRIIGVSVDRNGKRALRMALQSREQHIRREKATSNICTAQALLANTAAMYAVYHGPQGLYDIGNRTHLLTKLFADSVKSVGNVESGKIFFDTVVVNVGKNKSQNIMNNALNKKINLRLVDSDRVGIAFDETTTLKDVEIILECFGVKTNNLNTNVESGIIGSPFERKSKYLQHEVFNSYHTEHEILRYMHRLESKDIGLNTSMIPLGSCTMKLNATSEMIPITWPEINSLHPFIPLNQAKGMHEMFKRLENDLAKITGFHSVTLQPNSGAQGEYTGLLLIKKYLQSLSDGDKRNVCLIPVSAHGTNPATASMVGMKVVVVNCDHAGNVDVDDLKKKALQYKDTLACLMITYPSTHGVFEESIIDICQTVHDCGGQVYMDGANMNAQVGLTSPASIGADVCHLNLHKTFCIPHGGGGPGVGAVGCAEHLTPYLPSNPVVKIGGKDTIGSISAAPWGSASILPIPYMYITMMGAEGLTKATKMAILNANYMAKRLEPHYPILYRGKQGYCAHEFIMDVRPFQKTAGIEGEDVAKRLMDYGFHAPTLSFPIVNTLMIEPTESESKEELDRLIDALLQIRQEIKDIEDGKVDRENNVLKNAPHTVSEISSDKWDRPYSREQAAFPVPWLRDHKHWPSCSRIDGVFGDKNLVCTCAPTSDYA